jgi:hypothetical protein
VNIVNLFAIFEERCLVSVPANGQRPNLAVNIEKSVDEKYCLVWIAVYRKENKI